MTGKKKKKGEGGELFPPGGERKKKNGRHSNFRNASPGEAGKKKKEKGGV